MLASAVLVPFLFSADVTDRAALRGGACAAYPALNEVTDWLRHNTPEPSRSEKERPAYGVFASWTYGHQIDVLGQRPVVLDPLNYESGGGMESLLERLWLAEDLQQLEEELRALGVRYIVLTNPAEGIVGAMRRRGAAVADLYRRAPGGGFELLPGMNRFAVFTLFATVPGAADPPGLRLRFATRSRERVSLVGPSGNARSVSLPQAHVYELEPLALLSSGSGSSSRP